jgi:gamma-glutamyltranspeptidase / glutathione hydrolase
MRSLPYFLICFFTIHILVGQSFNVFPPQTQKPPLHAKHWMAITGKPLAATAGAMIFNQGGNAVDASCAMLAATCTMWDVLSWGGELQALIYNPKTKEVIGINGLGFAPKAATVDYYKSQGYSYPPEYGPLAAVTPGIPGGLMTALSEYGTMSLRQVLAPAMELAAGYPIEAQTANAIERQKSEIKKWPYSQKVMLPHLGEKREAPVGGEIFIQKELLATLQKLVDAEAEALRKGKSRKEAIIAAYDRFYKGDIAEEIARGTQEQGGLITTEDLATWKVKIEKPYSVNYKGIEVYKLQEWTQGPVLLQCLNMLEHFDLKSMGYNSTRYIHTLYQVMNYAYADRDFYYGDPDFSKGKSPIQTLLSKAYAQDRIQSIDFTRNDPQVGPGDPFAFVGQPHPYLQYLKPSKDTTGMGYLTDKQREEFATGTTTVVAADKDGWVVTMTPSGGWVPACIAGNTGVGLSQRMQSFVLDPRDGPYNVLEPHKRPRVTLTPSLAMKDGKPYLAFAKQAGDEQDQLLLQFFLNMTEFGMTVQEACEAPSFKTYQMRSSFGKHDRKPGAMTLNDEMPTWTRQDLRRMGYTIDYQARTSGPVNAIYFDWLHGSMWGGSSNHGEDYGIGW